MIAKVGQKVIHEGRVGTVMEVRVQYLIYDDELPTHQKYCYGAQSTDMPTGHTEFAVPIPSGATADQIEALRSIIK